MQSLLGELKKRPNVARSDLLGQKNREKLPCCIFGSQKPA